MPENNQITIRFAGKDLDAREFVRRAQSKAVLWMDYLMLLGDERTDFMNSFNDVLLGIVNGTYSVSEFGKIQGIPEYENNYLQKNGERASGNPTIFSSRRVGFNPYGNVETYLNGVANTMSAVEVPEVEKPKGLSWHSGYIYDLIGDSIYGAGNDPSLELLSAWANRFDPYQNGLRPVVGRKAELARLLTLYKNDLNNGVYNISDDDRLVEIAKIDDLINSNFDQFSLGKINPDLNKLMFTDLTYKTPEQKAQETEVNNLRNYINNGGDVPYDLLTLSTEHNNAVSMRTSKLQSDFLSNINNYNKDLPTVEKTIKGYTDVGNRVLHTTEIRNMTPNTLALLELIEKSSDLTELCLENWAHKINNNYIYTDWDSGLIIIASKDSDGLLKVISGSLPNIFNQISSDVQAYLFLNWLQIKRIDTTGIPLAEKGGILKFMDGGPNSRKDKEKPVTGSTDEDPIEGEVGEDEKPEDRTIPDNYETGRVPSKHPTINPYDAYIQGLENRKLHYSNFINDRVTSTMKGILAMHYFPHRKEYKHFTDKPLEDLMAANTAAANNMGAIAARGTADQGAAQAYLLAHHTSAIEANSKIAAQIAKNTNDRVDKAIATNDANEELRYKVATLNAQADTQLYNMQQQMEAERLKKQGLATLDNMTLRQQGAAKMAKANEQRDLNWSIYNDPAVRRARDQVNKLLATYYTKGLLTEAEEKALTRALWELKTAVDDATIRANWSYRPATTVPYGAYGYTYQQAVANPVAFRKGGKLSAYEYYKKFFKK